MSERQSNYMERSSVNTRPSDEKLREVIIEKDREIERLKNSLARINDQDNFNHSLLEKERKKNVELQGKLEEAEKVICEFQPEAILEREATLMDQAEAAKEVAKQYRADAIHLMDLNEGESEEKGLAVLKDAERYRKLKARIEAANSKPDGYHVFDLAKNETVDEVVDALPEISHEENKS